MSNRESNLSINILNFVSSRRTLVESEDKRDMHVAFLKEIV